LIAKGGIMIKNRLLDIRLSLHFKKQKEFADFLELSQNQYNRYENNVMQPSSEVLYRIAKKLNIPMENIIYEEE
jgi:putative transcriptional regulator